MEYDRLGSKLDVQVSDRVLGTYAAKRGVGLRVYSSVQTLEYSHAVLEVTLVTASFGNVPKALALLVPL
jgi:hypothetical protein